jgi:hypothetical protein
MTTCIIVGLLVTCSGMRSATPDEAVRTFMASATPIPTVPAPILGGSYLPPPLRQPVFSPVPPLWNQWTSMTTYLPRSGPPVTMFTTPLHAGRAIGNRPASASRRRTR